MKYSAYSGLNRDDAVRDAQAAAERAKRDGLPVSYSVVRIATEETFRA